MLSEEQLATETDEGLNKRIPELPETALGTDRATLAAVVYNPATNKTEQTPLVADKGLPSILPGDLLNLLNSAYWNVAGHGEYIGPDMTTTEPSEYYRPATNGQDGILLKTDGTPRGVSRFLSI